jgi:hypothetical protein
MISKSTFIALGIKHWLRKRIIPSPLKKPNPLLSPNRYLLSIQKIETELSKKTSKTTTSLKGHIS